MDVYEELQDPDRRLVLSNIVQFQDDSIMTNDPQDMLLGPIPDEMDMKKLIEHK